MNFLDQFKLTAKSPSLPAVRAAWDLEMATALSQAGAQVALMARREKYFDEARAELPDAHCVAG